jgi:hypothetical protein
MAVYTVQFTPSNLEAGAGRDGLLQVIPKQPVDIVDDLHARARESVYFRALSEIGGKSLSACV